MAAAAALNDLFERRRKLRAELRPSGSGSARSSISFSSATSRSKNAGSAEG
jgi:hypothetical protein